MNQHKHSLDDFLKKQVEEADFTYQEDYWNKMSALLDEDEKKKKYPFFWRGLSILLVLLTVGIASYLLPKWSHKKDAPAPSSSQPLSSATQSIPPSAKQDLPQENSDNNTVADPSMPSTSNSTTSTSNSTQTTVNTQASATTPSTDDAISTQTNPNNQSIDNQKSSNTTTQTSVSNTTPKSQRYRSNTNVNAGVSANSSKSTFASKAQNPISNSSTTATTNHTSLSTSSAHPLSTSNNVANPAPTKSSADIVSTKGKSNKPKGPISNKKKKSDDNTTSPSTASSSDQTTNPISTIQSNQPSTSSRLETMKPVDTSGYTVPRRDESIYNPRYVSSLRDYIPKHMDSVTVITYQPSPSEAKVSTTTNENIQVEHLKEASYRFRLMVLGGLNANKGLKGNVSNAMSWGFSPYLGVGVDRQVNSKITLSSHIGFTYFNGLNSQYVVNSYKYGFGLDSSSVAILHKKLLQLYLPFSMYYQISRNHYLLASIGASYGMDVSSEVKETTMSNNGGYYNLGKSNPTTTTKMASGYRSGFNQFDTYFQLGYAYRVMNQLMIQASVQQGFFDMTKNTYFNNTQSDRQTRLSIGIKYNFKRN